MGSTQHLPDWERRRDTVYLGKLYSTLWKKEEKHEQSNMTEESHSKSALLALIHTITKETRKQKHSLGSKLVFQKPDANKLFCLFFGGPHPEMFRAYSMLFAQGSLHMWCWKSNKGLQHIQGTCSTCCTITSALDTNKFQKTSNSGLQHWCRR